MTETKYFVTKGEAINKIPTDHLINGGTPVIEKSGHKYRVAFYNKFGEYLGILQEDGTVQKKPTT